MWCSHCRHVKPRKGQRLCNDCHAAYQRGARPKHRDLPEGQRRKAVVRSIAKVYASRGKLPKQPCRVCGSTVKVERHHPNYSKPLKVVHLCRKHHLELHAAKA